MQEKPDWAKILMYIYSQGGSMNYPQFDFDEHDLVEDTDLTRNEAHHAFQYLQQADLVEVEFYKTGYDKHLEPIEEPFEVKLSKKGFDVAHEREQRGRQHTLLETQNKANKTLATFTVILGATALVQAAAAVFSTPYPTNALLGVIYVGVLVALWLSRDEWLMMEGK